MREWFLQLPGLQLYVRAIGLMPNHRIRTAGVAVVVAATLFLAGTRPCLGSPERGQVGLKVLAMPSGTFELGYGGGTSRAPAFPALGLSPYADFSVTRYLLVGVGAELLLNVIPDIYAYQSATMLNLVVRAVGVAPLTTRLGGYGVITGGYSALFADGIGNPRGPVMGGAIGVTLTIWGRNAVFGEVGYQVGFQRAHPGADDQQFGQYAVRYLQTGFGWQFSF